MPLGFDCILLQSNLSMGEEISIAEIAARVFCENGKLPGKVAHIRAQQAAQRLVMLKLARPLYRAQPGLATQPGKATMTHIQSTVTSGDRLSAMMYLTVRKAVLGRKVEGRDAVVTVVNVKNEEIAEPDLTSAHGTSCGD